MRTSTALAALVSLSLGCARTAGPGDPGGPDNDPTDRDDGTGSGTGSETLDAWLEDVGCPHQDPPNRFSGDLLYVYSIAPEGGSFTDDDPAGPIATMEGTIDWEAGHFEGTATYVEGHPTLRVDEVMDFELGQGGGYTATTSAVATLRSGGEARSSAELRVQGCERWTTHHDETQGLLTESWSQIVDPDEIHWEAAMGPEDGSYVFFEAWGVNTADYRTVEHFVEDHPDTSPSPDREGTCTHEPDGTGACEAVTWWEDGGREEASLSTTLEGDSTSVWQVYLEAEAEEPAAWGTTFQAWEGSGWMEWVTVIWTSEGQVEVACTGEWDEAGDGTWSCDDGRSGEYAEGQLLEG